MTLALRYSTAPDSLLARWDARWKLAAILIAVASIVTLDHLWPTVLALGLAVTILAFSRLPWKWVRVRLGLFAFASLPFVVILPFTLEGEGWDHTGFHFW